MFIPTSNHPAYFITLNTNNRTDVFDNDKCCRIIVDAWKFYERKYEAKIMNYVIMPDHLHFILYFLSNEEIVEKTEKMTFRGKTILLSNKTLNRFLTQFKQFTGKTILHLLKEAHSLLLTNLILRKEKIRRHWFSLWQEDKYLIVINNPLILQQKIEYIRKNPVVAGLVKNWYDYKYVK